MSGRIEDQVIVTDADILVGVPCYKDGAMVDRCLRSLIEPRVQLLIVDNGSSSDVKDAIQGRGVVIRNDVNRYVNPAFNQMMRYFLDRPGRYDLLVLANSDLVLDGGWASALRAHRAVNRHEQIIFGVDSARRRSSMGSFFAMTRRAVAASYPVPVDMLIMGGDDFIFHVCRGPCAVKCSDHCGVETRSVGCPTSVVEAITMSHVERGTYDKSPEVWDIARRDTERWNQYVLRDLVPRRIDEFLARDEA